MTKGTIGVLYENLPAVGHVLRHGLSKRWLRVHSLPESKRYAETDAEYVELLRRHNEVALDLLGQDETAFLYLHHWGTAADFSAAYSRFPWATALESYETTTAVRSRPDLAPAEDPCIAGFSIRWSPHAWDGMLRDVADDRVPSVVLVNPKTGEAYAPYDGGADLFLAHSGRIATLATRWSAWLSKRPDGL